MLWIDTKYAKLIAYRLHGFKEIKLDPWTANFRCPICGDSHKNKRKKRGYFFAKKNDLWMKCFNCMPDQAMHFGTFLKQFDYPLYQQYSLERYKNDVNKHKAHKAEPDFKVSVATKLSTMNDVQENNAEFLKGLKRIDSLSTDHPAMRYVINRKIPKEFYSVIYYAPKFITWAETNTDRFKLNEGMLDHPRLVLPWYDESGKIFGYVARAFGKETNKYFRIMLEDREDKFYGLDRLDRSKPIYVVEGPIDSFFLPNCIAVGNASLMSFIKSDGEEVIYVHDNEPRNLEVVNIIEHTVNSGSKLFIPPEGFIPKDLNQAIEDGYKPEELLAIIQANTYHGITAKLHFNKWKKIEREANGKHRSYSSM